MNALALVVLALTMSTPEGTSNEEAPGVLDKLVIDAEVGPGYVFQNDNRFGPTGTKYSAAEVGQRRNLFVAKRVAVEAQLAERHSVILLYAPLDLRTRAVVARNIDFKGTLFTAGDVVDHRYLFDSYRASYLYGVVRQRRWAWDFGGSFQIRNASVEMATVDARPALYELESDIGLVFALKTRLTFRPNNRLWSTLEADAFSTFGAFSQFSGGIYDVALSVGTPVGRGIDGFLRLRLLGGGATVARRDIDTWANFAFAVAGAKLDLGELFSSR